MTTMSVWRVLRAMAGLEGGRWCRDCDEAILANDAFGRSEGVCRPCRATSGS